MPYKLYPIRLRNEDFSVFCGGLGWFLPKLQFDGAPRVFDQMTSDQAHVGPLHTLYHHLGRWEDLFYLTRPNGV